MLIALNTDYQNIKKAFLKELKEAANGKKKSVSFIKHYLPEIPPIKNGIIQAFVIGGTNYIYSIEEITPGKTKTLKRKEGTVPVFKSTKIFEAFLRKHLASKVDAVAFNFAYPLKPYTNAQGLVDGKLIRGTKEHEFKGLLGSSIGEFIQKVYFKKFKKHILATVANDTVCLALSGKGNGGIIVGTGFNISLKMSKHGKTFIANLESGNFNGFKPDMIVEKIDNESDNKGINRYEKMLSGNYLFAVYNNLAENLNKPLKKVLTSEMLSKIAQTDKTASGDLARSIFGRSSSLVAAQIAGIYEFMNRPKKLTFITEGSLFWKGWNYEKNVKKELANLGIPAKIITFKPVADSSLKGAIALIT